MSEQMSAWREASVKILIASEDVRFNDRGFCWDWFAPKNIEKVELGQILVSTTPFWFNNRRICKSIEPEFVKNQFEFPPLLTREFIDHPPDKKIVRICVVNGFGNGIGDCISGLVAVQRLSAEFERRGRRLVLDIIARDGTWTNAHETYAFEPSIDRVWPHGCPLGTFLGYDAYVDTEDYITELDQLGLHLYDYMCHRLFVREDPPAVPVVGIGDRPVIEVAEVFDRIPKPHILLSFFASSIRQIPRFLWKRFVTYLAKKGSVILVGAHSDKKKLERFEKSVREEMAGQVFDVSEVVGRSTHHLWAATQAADLVVTPDTGLLHMAGIVGVPTLAVFYSIEPSLRVRDFPNVTAYAPECFRKGPHWGRHKPDFNLAMPPEKEKLTPEAFHDAMDAALKLYADPMNVPGYEETWKQFDVREFLDLVPGPRQESRLRVCPMRRNPLCETDKEKTPETSSSTPSPSSESSSASETSTPATPTAK